MKEIEIRIRDSHCSKFHHHEITVNTIKSPGDVAEVSSNFVATANGQDLMSNTYSRQILSTTAFAKRPLTVSKAMRTQMRYKRFTDDTFNHFRQDAGKMNTSVIASRIH